MKKNHLFVLLPLLLLGASPLRVFSQSETENYVLTRTYREAGNTASQYMDRIQYYDGLGRESQLVLKQFAPDGSDLVSGVQYDSFGRKWRESVPVPSAYSDGRFVISLFSRAALLTDDAAPYSETAYEPSPLDRILAQTGPGAAWHNAGKARHTEYLVNDNTPGSLLSVYRYTVGEDGTIGTPSLYAPGELKVTLSVGEDNDSTLTFTDKREKTVLARSRNRGVSHDTYYVYDDYGLLRHVLPPSANGNTDATTLARHAYSYQYDGRNRCIEKKLPGCETVRLIYDRADRLVLEQNGTQRAGNRWTVHKYDAIGRLLYSFEHTDATDTDTLRTRLSGIWATESDSGNDPLGIGYTNTTVGWGSDVRLLEVNYYDDYSFLDKLTSAERNALTYAARSGYDTCHTYADGLPTGNRHYLPDGTGRYVATALYYDSKGRTVQQTRTNLKGGYDRDSYANSFTGQVTKHFYTHTGSASDTVSLTCEYFYMYDSNDRLVAVDCALNGGTRSALYRLSYDSYGRMQQKTFGNGLYASTYDYNLRGWLTGISGSKFSQNLYYNTGNGTPCYNGNISSMTWQAGGETTTRGYKFTYDGLNRMLDAVYGEGTSLNTNVNRFTEKVTGYDKNGNILALQRYGQTGTSSYGLIDNLTFTLDGNQLNRVDDAVTASAYNNGFEFKDAVKQANEYAYDANGNLTKDLNKNISNIQYNCLNLPRKVTFTDGSTIEYTYAADGTKLRTKHVINGTTTTTDYCGNVIYENGVQKLLLTEAGYVTLADSKYHYYLQDHQGNNRVVIDQNGTVEETNHYYPFGGVFANSTSVQPYKYNGKELDTKKGLNWYDYGARHYDAALGRFATVDRFADKYSSMSPYQYAANNPVVNLDINGDSIITTLTTQVDGKTVNVDYTYRTDSKGNYGFFDAQGNKYSGEDAFMNNLSKALADLREGAVGNALVNELINSERKVNIANRKENGADLNGSYVTWNASDTEGGLNTAGNTTRPAYIGLGHELAHIQDIWRGTVVGGEWANGVPNTEKYATHVENQLRSEHKLPLRTHYGITSDGKGDPHTPLLRTGTGVSLYFKKKVTLGGISVYTTPYIY